MASRLAVTLAALATLGATATRAGTRGADLAVVAKTVMSRGHAYSPAVIVIRDGRVVSVTERGDAPPDLPLLDARSLTVVPGFVDARSGAGLPSSTNEEAVEVTPAFSAIDLVDGASPAFERALSGGVTTVAVSPGGRAVVGGRVGVLKTTAGRLEDRTLSRDAGLFVTMGLEPPMGNRLGRFERPHGLYFRRPGNRMGVVAEIERAFQAVGPGSARHDEDAAVLRRALRGESPTFLRARTEADILAALRIARELGLRPVLVDPVEAHRIPEEIRAAGAPCILGPSYQQPRDLLELWEGEDVRHGTAKALHDAGVLVAIGTGPTDSPGSLREAAALAARGGLPLEVALAAITSVPASLLGVSARVGDIAPGLDGDLVVLDGPPLHLSSRVVAVVVGGRVVRRDASVALTEPARPQALLNPVDGGKMEIK